MVAIQNKMRIKQKNDKKNAIKVLLQTNLIT